MAQTYEATPVAETDKLSQFPGTVNGEFDDLRALFSETATFTVGHQGTYLVDATSGAVTVNLPAASSSEGWVVVVKKIAGGGTAVTVDGNGSETIDGSTTKTLSSNWDFVRLVCNGTAWFIVGE